MSIIYKDFEFKEKALALSEKELNKKVPEYIKCWIKCMRAIVLKDCEPPKMFLKGEGKKRVIDVDRFLQDIVEKID